MTAEALAIVFSPNLLRAPQNDFVMILNNMGLSHKLVKALITHVGSFFLFSVVYLLIWLTPSSTSFLTKLSQTLRRLLKMS